MEAQWGRRGVFWASNTISNIPEQSMYKAQDVVQVNIPAESGDMGVLANHVPSIEQLKPGLVEVISEGGGSKSFFRTLYGASALIYQANELYLQSLEASRSFNPTPT